MLIKEYRIPLPLTNEEYRVAQLFMIAKKSRQESHGEGSGIEILINEPYTDGPGPNGKGQYTRKVYHVGSHLPAWLKSLIPKSALSVEEEAWNAYPYTKTRYTCPFVEKFSIEVETYYFNDGGHQENVFNLSKAELKQREVDVIDIVKDQVIGADYSEDEDPRKFVSQKTLRGPLMEDWISEYWNECKDKNTPLTNGKAIMCAYKLCKVEFRYWGMQSKIERFIHDIALRKTMLRAHRQAWAWIDEWWGLTIEDIRSIEAETQAILAQQYAENCDEAPNDLLSPESTNEPSDDTFHGSLKRGSWVKSASRNTLNSHTQVSWRMESIRRDSVSSGSEEEYFDCYENAEVQDRLQKWSSLEIIPTDDINVEANNDSIFSHDFRQRLITERQKSSTRSVETPSPSLSPSHHHSPCATSALILVVHAGSVLDINAEISAKKSDVTTLRGSFEHVIRQHYPQLIGRVAIRLIGAPSVFSDCLNILSSLNPFEVDDGLCENISDVPVGALPILGTLGPQYEEAVGKLLWALNSTYSDFMHSEEGHGFNGQICVVGDGVGGVLCYDALCKFREGHAEADPVILGDEMDDKRMYRKSVSEMGGGIDPPNSCNRSISDSDYSYSRHLSTPRRKSSGSSETGTVCERLEFEVNDLFLFGCPLSLVLLYRKIISGQEKTIQRPSCQQVYNLFYATDPLAVRIEPLISARFSLLSVVQIPRYTKYPLGSGQVTNLLAVVQENASVFVDTGLNASTAMRRTSDASIVSSVSGITENVPVSTSSALSRKWWGTKRIDYTLYCPEGLSNFPDNSLPHLFHASYWESFDVVAFIIRQLVRVDSDTATSEGKDLAVFQTNQPREKWQKKRTSVKIKNIAANHRGNDVIVRQSGHQDVHARFMYGPLDMVALSGEKVDVHIMRNPPSGDWELITTATTDKTGRLSTTIPTDRQLGYGMFPAKMVVRGDHTTCSLYVAVLPPKTECVVFSIDGSFTASVSVSGKDPKVRAGAVDVVRHWQELGYLIIYITGRPDMQQRRVVSWLAQHNFPHGLVSFADGLSTDPLGHKAHFLRRLIQECEVQIEAAYGSSKDISVYSSIGLKSHQIFIVGKVGKKQYSVCQPLCDGYAAHLSQITSLGRSRPARSNPQINIPKGFFGLPGQNNALRRRSSLLRFNSNYLYMISNIVTIWKSKINMINPQREQHRIL